MSTSLTKRPTTANGKNVATNIWQIMGYAVPRGKCVHKPSMLSSGCPCLRFMLNPLQAASTFTCDGCGHHASFHEMKGDYTVPTEEEGVNGTASNGTAKRKRIEEDDGGKRARG